MNVDRLGYPAAFLFLYFASYWLLASKPQGQVVALVLVSPLIWLSLCDLRRHVIPDAATLLVAVLGVILALLREDSAIMLSFALAAALLVVLGLLGELYWRRNGREAIGFGDAKLIAAGALVVGVEAFWAMLLLASIGGLIAALISRGRGREGIPFGPFIAYAIFVTFVISGYSV